MFVYTETVYRSLATGTLEVTRRCSGCGKDSDARVNSLSEGQAASAYGLSNKQALAGDRATRGLAPIAQSILDLAACPHCGAREPHVLKLARRGSLSGALLGHAGGVAMLVLSLATLGLGASVALEPRVDTIHTILTFLVGLGFGAGWFFLVRSVFRKRLRAQLDTIDGQVVWLVGGAEPAPIEAPPVVAPAPSGGWPFA